MLNIILLISFCMPTFQPVRFFSEIERQALVLAIAVEAGARPNIEKEVVMHVIYNHANLPMDNTAHWTILEAIGTYNLANGVLGVDRSGTVQSAYDYLGCKEYREDNPYCKDYWIENYFKPAERFVNDFINNPRMDFTQGALYFVHTNSKEEAQGIAQDMMNCQQNLPRYIIEAGVTPYINSNQIYISSVGITVYSNINIMPPLKRYNTEGQKFYDCPLTNSPA